MDPITVAKLWLLVKPVKRFKAWRAKRKGQPMAIDIGTRTSTNAGVAGIAVQVLLQLLQLVPGAQELASSPEIASGLTVLVMWAVARFSKTPAEPGKL